MNESGQRVSGEQRGEDERPDATPQDEPVNEESGESASSEAPDAEEGIYALSIDELESILERHRLWVESGGDEGERADLCGADLRETDLTDADLRGALLKAASLKDAELWDTNLEGAILVKADLEGAVATGASFRRAQLLEANLMGCELHGADFSEAYLQNANLEGVRGLQVEQLKGANVSNATLPPPVAAFDGLGRVTSATQYARKLFFTILAGCAYCWLTIAMTTDVGLITNTAASPLPIIGTTIPIVGFYWVAPLTLLVLYVYFHLQLQRLWEELATLPAVFPDGKPLDKKADPWLLIGLVRNNLAHLKEEHLPFFSLQKGTIILVAWWVVPITLGFFGFRYLSKHDPEGTAFLLLLIVVAAWLAISFYRNASAILRGDRLARFEWKHVWKDWRVLVILLAIGAAGLPFTVDVADRFPAADLNEADLRELDLRGVRLERARLYRADLRRSRLGDAQFQGAYLREARLDSATLTDADLSGADLTHANLSGAVLGGATLSGADLSGADLSGANLYSADLHGADLTRADLSGANLSGANLTEANLSGAYLAGADVSGADLDEADLVLARLNSANLSHTDLTGANLSGANLSGADLFSAVFTDAILTSADFTDALVAGVPLADGYLPESFLIGGEAIDTDLTRATGLSVEWLCSATVLAGTRFDPELQAGIERECPEKLSPEAAGDP